MFRNFGLPNESNWWEHKPPKAIENKNATIFDIQTDNTIQVNRPDIVVKIIMIKLVFSLICLCLVIPLYHTKSKLSKDKDLEIEVTKIWHLKTTTLTAVIGGLGMVAKTSPNYVSKIPGSPSLTELQKITLRGTAQFFRNIFIYLFAYLFIYLFSYLFIYLFICLFS